ncbi:MAG: hydantoinase/oxoprolinase family protein [Lautropia sp.]
MTSPTRTPADPIAIGVDTGGTHTDLVLAGAGRLVTLKVPSTTDDLSVGIVDGVRRIVAQAGVPMSAVTRFVYASTFVTNLFIEGKQAPVGLITTGGFRDVLQIGRASRKPDVYDIHWRPARPLVPRHLRFGVTERIDHKGEVVTPLDEREVRAALAQLAAAGVGSIAVCLLHAYRNPAHERRIGELAASVCPGIDVSLSSEVIREFREYERTSTTCVNAFIKQPITRHLERLRRDLAAEGMPAVPFMMRGNGGVSTFDSAAQAPTAVTHSGVMGGIVGANALAARCGIANLITLDMGGTSADVALIAGNRPVLTNRSSIGAHPLLVPTLDMVTIGAGGGSIAWLESGAALRVGPHSAGSQPGPASYGQGGRDPTVTDANIVTGRLSPDYFLGGARRLDPALAHQAIESRIAAPLGLSVEAAALGILAIAEAHMANAIRLVSVERGLDPREFTLVAFGGAGALHAIRLAEALSIGAVLIPPAPGNLSAMGLLCADVRHDLTRTVFARPAPALAPRLLAAVDELMAEADAALAADQVAPPQRSFTLSADLRYEGQNYELTVPITRDEIVAGGAEGGSGGGSSGGSDGSGSNGFVGWAQRFGELHQRIYGYRLHGRGLQLVNLRVTATGAVVHAEWPELAAAADAAEPAGRRSVVIDADSRADATVYRFERLRPGHRIAAPAIVEYAGGTLFVPPGWHGVLDAWTNIRLTRVTVAASDPAATAAAAARTDAQEIAI